MINIYMNAWWNETFWAVLKKTGERMKKPFGWKEDSKQKLVKYNGGGALWSQIKKYIIAHTTDVFSHCTHLQKRPQQPAEHVCHKMLTAIAPMFGTVGHSMEAKDNAVLIKWQTVALSGLEMQCSHLVFCFCNCFSIMPDWRVYTTCSCVPSQVVGQKGDFYLLQLPHGKSKSTQ